MYDVEDVEKPKRKEAILNQFYALNWASNAVADISSEAVARIEEAIRNVREILVLCFEEEYPLIEVRKTSKEPEKGEPQCVRKA